MNTNLVWISWVITSYSLTQTVMMPMAGKLSDDFGRKRLFLGCVALFTVSSLLCSLAPNVYLLILFRILQACGGGAFLPSAAGIVSDVFDPRHRQTAIGLFTSVFPLGGIIGPNIGGWMIDQYRLALDLLGECPDRYGALRDRHLPAAGRWTRIGDAASSTWSAAAAFAVGILGLMMGMSIWGDHAQFGPSSRLHSSSGSSR